MPLAIRHAIINEIGMQQSVRYEGALPWRQLYTIVASLYFTRSGTSSQRSLSSQHRDDLYWIVNSQL